MDSFLVFFKANELDGGCENRKDRRKASSLETDVLVLSILGKYLGPASDLR